MAGPAKQRSQPRAHTAAPATATTLTASIRRSTRISLSPIRRAKSWKPQRKQRLLARTSTRLTAPQCGQVNEVGRVVGLNLLRLRRLAAASPWSSESF
jgi:hypothetical protein